MLSKREDPQLQISIAVLRVQAYCLLQQTFYKVHLRGVFLQKRHRVEVVSRCISWLLLREVRQLLVDTG